MRFLKTLLLLFILLPVIAYFVANYALDKGSQQLPELAKKHFGAFGIQLDKFEYDSVRVSSLRSVTWHNVRVRFHGTEEKLLVKDAEFQVVVSEFKISLDDFSTKTIRLSAIDFNAAPSSQAVQNLIQSDPKIAKGFASGSVEGQIFEISTIVDLKNPRQSMKSLAKELFGIAKKGSTRANIYFKGKVRSHIRDSDIEATVLSEKNGNVTRFVLDRNDVARISQKFDDELTEHEIDIIANNPAKAPLLFTIKDYAETRADDAYEKDNSVPQDPYRHVLWSYLLTKEFGPDFARIITDAHEQGPTGNSALERKQDYNNNRIGRQYAADGVLQKEILKRVRSDPKVMKDWNRG